MSTTMKRVRVLPHALLLENTTTKHRIPEEPSEPPPATTNLTSLLVVGDDKVGKSSLIKSFVSHETIPIRNEASGTTAQQPSTTTDATSSTNQKSPAWSVAYEKKKFSFWNQHNSLRSLFVQCLEVSGLNPGNHHSATRSSMQHLSEWNKLWKKASMVLLVLNVSESPDNIPQKIATWKRFLDSQQQPNGETTTKKKPVVLMLHQGDKLAPRHPTFWIHFGKKISDICHKLHIESWHITSSCLEDEDLGGSIDAAFCEILGDQGKPVVACGTSTTASLSTGTPLVAHPPDDTTTTPGRKEPKKQSNRIVSPLT